MKNAWKRVSLRSIEPLNYNIIDLSHPLQAGRTDKLMDKAAVLDTIPYSRVFYHAYPGAIIMHRGRRLKIECKVILCLVTMRIPLPHILHLL